MCELHFSTHISILTFEYCPLTYLLQMFKAAFRPSSEWGPKSSIHMASWWEFKETMRRKREKRTCSRVKQFIYVIFCLEHKLV